MKSENFNNFKPEQIPEKEVQGIEKPEENIERIAVKDIEKEIEELDVIEIEKEKGGLKMSTLKKSMKKAIVGISIGLALMMATEATAQEGYQWQEGQILTPKKSYKMEDLFKAVEEQEKTEKIKEEQGKISPETEAKKQEIYNRAIEKIKNYLGQERDFSWIKNPSLRRTREGNEKRLRLQYQTILEHSEKVQVKFNPENNAILFSGTYIDPVSGIEQSFNFLYQGVEKGK